MAIECVIKTEQGIIKWVIMFSHAQPNSVTWKPSPLLTCWALRCRAEAWARAEERGWESSISENTSAITSPMFPNGMGRPSSRASVGTRLI